MLKSRKILALTTAIMTMFSSIASITQSFAATYGHAAHSIAASTSFNDNPLKGFMPYSMSATTFPHSLEYFYIPMSSFYPNSSSTPTTTPTWTTLENELNAISARGNQAVFRVYLDYPAMKSAIPTFLLNYPYNLVTRNYTDYGNSQSKSPDYEDLNLRATMKNLISALGAKYDGDSRIGFIKVGFLGFWGEWHCYPHTTWEPSLTVKNEIINAFDKAFTKTRFVMRYPAGYSVSNSKIGYHDDSYVYETLPVSMGGETWNFAQQLIDSGTQNRWQTAPIGGELRPEIQNSIFTNSTWTGGNGETWANCLKVTHPSWMLNEGVKSYSGNALTNAITAQKQMGYDFSVTNAYYDNITSSDKLYLGIDIKNIGAAPFYYDHSSWPVKVGIKQNGTLVKSWTTLWDLNTISADSSIKTFEYTTPDVTGLTNGTYNICIMVQNPLSNGKKLGFANVGQNLDGWLDLGTFTVAGTVTPIETPTQAPTEIPTSIPTITPTEIPTPIPTITPTEIPAPTPTAIPTSIPTVSPIVSPTATSTAVITQIVDNGLDSISMAAPVPVGSLLQGSVDYSGDGDWYKFKILTTGTYIIQSTGTVVDTWGSLKNSKGRAIASDNNSGGNGNFKIITSLNANTDYYLYIDGQPSGKYYFSIQKY